MSIIEGWPPRNVLQIIALVASILGRVALFGLAIWLVFVVKTDNWPAALRGEQLGWLGWALIIILVGSLMRDLADGAILTPRKAQANKEGASFEAGSPEPINDGDQVRVTKE
jgi:hypothetical protein